jgi:hypothetical protein
MNLGEMRDYVRDRLSIAASDAIKQSQIDLIINTEYRRVCAEMQLNIERATLATVANSQLVDLPDDWQETITMRFGQNVLQPVNIQRFAELDATGEDWPDGPSFYYQESPERVRVWPTPTATDIDAITLWYVARPDTLAGAADVPSALPLEYHDLLTEMAVARVAQNEEAFDIAQAAQVTVAELRARLDGQMNRRQGAGNERVVLRYYGVGT